MPTGASGAPRTARSISTVRLLTVRSVDPMRVRCPGPIAEHNLLHLAGGGLGQSSELYGGRAFEVRQVFAAESNKLLRADAVSRLERDERLRPLPPLVVWNTDDRGLQHRGVPREGLLHLDGRNVLSARDNNVLLAVAQFDGTIGMHHAQVPRMEPPAAERFGGGVWIREVSRHHEVAAHHDLTQRFAVARDIAHVVVDHSHRLGDDVGMALPGQPPRLTLEGQRTPFGLPS